jgi:hypothetical protein
MNALAGVRVVDFSWGQGRGRHAGLARSEASAGPEPSPGDPAPVHPLRPLVFSPDFPWDPSCLTYDFRLRVEIFPAAVEYVAGPTMRLSGAKRVAELPLNSH